MEKINTIIINKLLIHCIDFEHSKVHLSDDFVEINDTTHDYYHKKIAKALNSNQLKDIVVASLHEMLLRGEKMIESNEEFKLQAKEITETFYKLGKQIDMMPNCTVFYADVYQDGVHKIAIIKVNDKYVPLTVVDENNVRITKKQLIPASATAVDEVILINIDQKKLQLIEKKYLIDGKMSYYLNEQWIKGEEKLTDKQKFNSMKKVVDKLDDQYKPNKDIDSYPVLKQEIIERLMNNDPLNAIDIVKKVVGQDYNASEESELMMKDLGIGEKDVIENFAITKSLEKVTLVLDNGIEVSIPLDDYIQKRAFTKKYNDDGTFSLTLDHIQEMIVK